MTRSLLIIAILLLASVSYAGFGSHTSNMDWYGEKYIVTISGELLETSEVAWDGKSTIPLSLDTAISRCRSWVKTQFPDHKRKFAGATLFFFARRKDETEGHWAYIINFENGVKELIEEHNAWRVQRLTFYVLMDGTLISPEKKQNNRLNPVSGSSIKLPEKD